MDREPERLSRVIGLGRVLFQSVATMAPGASVVFGLGLIILYAGVASPVAMLLGVVAALFVALCIGQLAQHVPSAGGFYSYASSALGDHVGFLVGWAYAVLYIVIICLSSLNFSLVFGDFLSFYFGLEVPYWPLVLLLILALTGITYLGVKPSTGLTMALGFAEVAILLGVGMLLIAFASSQNTVAAFNPANAAGVEPGAVRGLFLGVIFAFAALAGFEASAPMAEEAQMPRRRVPLAIVLATAVIGLFYVIAMYAAVVGWGPAELGSYVDSPNPWREMAGRISGFASFLVVLAILNSVIAGTQAGFNAASRLLFAMGRARAVPRVLSRVHPIRRSPHAAAVAAGGLATVATLVAAGWFGGPFPAFVFFLTVATVAFLVLYAVVSIATPVFFYRRRRNLFHPVLHLVVPFISLAVLGPTLYFSLQGLTYPANLAIPAILVWVGIGVVVLAAMRFRGMDISSERHRWLREDSTGQVLE